jgi:hypothetical protein
VGGELSSQGCVGDLWSWFALLCFLLSYDSVIQLLEESNRSLELQGDIASHGKYILDFIVQAPDESSTFCRIIPLNASDIVLEFHIIRGAVTLRLFVHLQFSFHCCHAISDPKCRFQYCNQCWDIGQVEDHVGNIGLDLGDGLVH